MDASDVIATVSAVFSFGALIVAWRVYRQSARGELSAEWVRRSPGGDRYDVGVTNVGGAPARHAVVTLFDDEGQRICEPSPSNTLFQGQSHTFVLVEPAREPVYPLAVRFEWRRWRRRWVERHEKLALLWRVRAESTRQFPRPDVERLDVPVPARASGPVYLRRSRATPAVVAQHLKPPDESSTPQSPPWADLMMYAGAEVLGEVKDPEDWERFPRDRAIRVAAVAAEGGQVIRWVADQQWVKNHDHFYRDGDAERPRTGNLTLYSEDEPMLVQS